MAVVCLLRPGLGWGQADAVLMGIDVYGTSQFTAADIESRYGGALKVFVKKTDVMYRARGPKAKEKAERNATRLKGEIEDKIQKAWGLAWVRLSWRDYFKAESHTVYVTIDAVERKDAKARMPFRRPPKKRFPDPSGLLAGWSAYSELGWSLVRKGDISPDRADCPAFFCTWGERTPELKRYQDQFVELLPTHKEALNKIMLEDADPSHRIGAVFLLAYVRNGNELSHILLDALQDPDSQVRNSALRIYADMAVYHPEVYLPIDRIIAALDYPTVEDRNKALAVLVGLADKPDFKSVLTHQAAPALVKLLRLKQPANHDLAYAILGILSKENYGAADYESWERWLREAQKNRSAGQ